MFHLLGRTAAALTALTLLLGGAALARPEAPSPDFPDAGPSILGTLTAVEVVAGRIRVQPTHLAEPLELTLAADVQIEQGGRWLSTAALEALQGHRVKVRYGVTGFKPTAWSVTVASPGPSQKPRSAPRRPGR